MFNLVSRTNEDVLAYCEANGIGFIPWFPLAAGDLSASRTVVGVIAENHGATPSQIALAWLLNKSPSILLIPGTSSIEHLDHNVEACGIKLSAEDVTLLDGFAITQKERHWMDERMDQKHSETKLT